MKAVVVADGVSIGNGWIDLPPSVAEFVARFDDRDYPHLVEDDYWEDDDEEPDDDE